MTLQLTILLLLVAVAVNTAFAETKEEEHKKRLVKRGIFDDLLDVFKNFGESFTDAMSNLKDFSAEKFEDFKSSLSSLTGEKKDDALNQLKEYYNNLADKSSTEALRVKESIEGLGGTVDGASCLKSSILGVTVLVLLCKVLF